MPYQGELAKYHVIRRIAESEAVKTFLRDCRVSAKIKDSINKPQFKKIHRSEWHPKWVIAIDGGNLEIPVQNGFPGAEVSYVSIASVMIDLELLDRLDHQRPINPAEFKSVQSADAEVSVFPGCNVCLGDEVSPVSSLRRQLLETLEGVSFDSEIETLLDTYHALLEYKTDGVSRPQLCPYDDCLKHGATYTKGKGEYECECEHRRPLYASDALRIHEGMNPAGSNGALFSEIRQVIERLWLIHLLRVLEQNNWLSSLKRIAIVIDGPLAVFGHPAWLKDAIKKELKRINKLARDVNGEDIFILGIEKTGAFAEHLISLDTTAEGSPGCIEPGSTLLLDDKYIKDNIIFSESEKQYGQQTYFGRKFFYKTTAGALIVGMVPSYEEHHANLEAAEVQQFPRINDAIAVLDKLVSSRYPNAVVPLVEANAEAAIPMRLGAKVLEKLAKELLDA